MNSIYSFSLISCSFSLWSIWFVIRHLHCPQTLLWQIDQLNLQIPVFMLNCQSSVDVVCSTHVKDGWLSEMELSLGTRYNTDAILPLILQLRLQEKSLLLDMPIWVHYDEAFELYGLQNSLQLAYNDWFLISDLNTSMNNIPRSGIRSCSLSTVYRLHMSIIIYEDLIIIKVT